MEKKVIHFLIITLVFLILWTYLTPKMFPPSSPPPKAGLEQDVTPTQPVTPTQETTDTDAALSGEEDEQFLKDVFLDNFYVTISLRGGYIKKIYIKKYADELTFQNLGYTPEYKDVLFTLSQNKNTLVLTAAQENVKKVFDFKDYLLTFRISSPGNNNSVLFSNILSNNMLDQRYQEFFYQQNQESPWKRMPLKKVKEQPINSALFGVRDRYFCMVFLDNIYESKVFKDSKTNLWIELDTPPLSTINIFLGPQNPKDLAQFGIENVINYGFFHWIAIILIKILYFATALTHNWGLSIIILSVVIYLILFPFTAKSTKSMKRMQALQPKIEEMKKKYKDNPQKLNKEILELYRTYKVNPLGGCLPLFFQLPVFIALYQTLFRFVELKGAHFLWIKDLSLPDRLFSLPFTFPFSLPFLRDLMAGHINILPILYMILAIFQQKLTMVQASQDQQKSMGLIFVVMIGVIFYDFPACLILYWLVQQVLTFLYQYRVSRTTPALD